MSRRKCPLFTLMTPSEPALEGRTRRVSILPSKTPARFSHPNPFQTGEQQTAGLPPFIFTWGLLSLQGWLLWDQLPRSPLLPTPTREPTLRRAFWTFSAFNSIHSSLFCANTLVCESTASSGWGALINCRLLPAFSQPEGAAPTSLPSGSLPHPQPFFFFSFSETTSASFIFSAAAAERYSKATV